MTRIKKILSLSVVLILLVLGLVPALPAMAAQIALSNAGFEKGDTTGWTTSLSGGTVEVVESYYCNPDTYYPTDGDYFAMVGAGTEGVYNTLSQTFQANAGDTITGFVFFVTTDYIPYTDDGYLAIKQGSTIIATLFSASISSVGSYGQTSWTEWEYTFASAGNYTLEAGVRNGGDSGVASYIGLDIEQFFPRPKADFEASITMGKPPLTVQFTDLSSGDIDSWEWDFGNGQTSDELYPIMTYYQPGSYTVSLTVTGPGGSDTAVQNITVLVGGAANISVNNIRISPAYGYPYSAITIDADVANNGGGWGSQNLDLFINGQFEQSASVGVSAGTTQTVRFTVYKTTPGQYTVKIGDATGYFNIQPTPTQQQRANPTEMGSGLIAGVVIIAVLLLAAIIVLVIVSRK